MDNEVEFLAPAPKETLLVKKRLPCPFSADGMLQPHYVQPPPMFGPRGPTIPAKHLAPYTVRRSVFNSNKNNKRRHQDSSPSLPRPPNRIGYGSGSGPFKKRSNGEFWCDSCELLFESSFLLSEHKLEHRICGINECKFNGSSTVVDLHIQSHHNSGLYDKIRKLNSPEEIASWRAERRKRYPSQKNVQLRQQAQSERWKRGERLNDGTSRFGRTIDRQKAVQNPIKVQTTNQRNEVFVKGKRGRKRARQNQKLKENVVQCKELKLEDDCNGTLPRFRGISQLPDYKPSAIKSRPKNVLSSLVGMYGSDSDSESDGSDDNAMKTIEKDDRMDVEDVTKVGQEKSSNGDQLINRQLLENDLELNGSNKPLEHCHIEVPEEQPLVELSVESDDEAPVEQSIEKVDKLIEVHPDTSTSVPNGTRRNIDNPKRNWRNSKKVSESVAGPTKQRVTLNQLANRYRHQNTMLEKLLQKDIRHERNVLLQCVRYVVENNFFGIGSENRKHDEKEGLLKDS